MRLLDLGGYYRPMAYARDGRALAFDGMNPDLAEGGWAALSADLGPPDATLDWVHGTIAMPGGERVYVKRGIAVFVNPSNHAVVYVMLFVPTTVDAYRKQLRPRREKR
jgi:hypothetical protein